MRPETVPLMYARQIDAAWYLGKSVCQEYQWADKDQREKAEGLILALVEYFATEQNKFGELIQILQCAEKYGQANGRGDVIPMPEPQKAPAEVKY
jgi:hypothetical protein